MYWLLKNFSVWIPLHINMFISYMQLLFHFIWSKMYEDDYKWNHTIMYENCHLHMKYVCFNVK